ncbi:bifunctional 2-polyprenyl-6-hydroxyphenol methylase/3-demethylubiquinol 3-O-methyltransferase UbiG [Synechococcus sp. 1G10]|uniref:class I SAM-dependent methyltransferase n=1 Tax=Synechococcus sp. 1G10 TaxID=2025605 RepID=UPI000B9958F6|nr:methyltransferase domain-containing protein [Synechococcus sp. 1G10]
MHENCVNPYQDDHCIDSVKESRLSAGVVLPYVFELLRPKSVVDIGCGMGSWLAECKKLGIDTVLGIDGYADQQSLEIDQHEFIALDLEQKFTESGLFDLAISLEVAEHLSQAASADFVASLVALAPVVLFSAAIPGQPGTGHINCQWPCYWAGQFYERGYVCFDILRNQFWMDDHVSWWYSQNMFLYVDMTVLGLHPELSNYDYLFRRSPLPLIHPLCYNMVRSLMPEEKFESKPKVLRMNRKIFCRLRMFKKFFFGR